MTRSNSENSGATSRRLTEKTGPRTARGKAASSRNATKHGLLAKDVVIPGESSREFDNFIQDLRRDLDPVGAVEEELVEIIANCMWRLRRARRIETSILTLRYVQLYFPQKSPGPDWTKDEKSLGIVYHGAQEGDDGAAAKIAAVMRYETTSLRSMDRALDRLEKLQTGRVVDLEPVELSIGTEAVEVLPAGSPDAEYAVTTGTGAV